MSFLHTGFSETNLSFARSHASSNVFFSTQVHLRSRIQQRAKDHYLQVQHALQLRSSPSCHLVKVLQVIRTVFNSLKQGSETTEVLSKAIVLVGLGKGSACQFCHSVYAICYCSLYVYLNLLDRQVAMVTSLNSPC